MARDLPSAGGRGKQGKRAPRAHRAGASYRVYFGSGVCFVAKRSGGL